MNNFETVRYALSVLGQTKKPTPEMALGVFLDFCEDLEADGSSIDLLEAQDPEALVSMLSKSMQILLNITKTNEGALNEEGLSQHFEKRKQKLVDEALEVSNLKALVDQQKNTVAVETANLAAEREKLEDEKSAVTHENDGLRSEIADLNKAIKELVDQKQGLGDQLRALQEQKYQTEKATEEARKAYENLQTLMQQKTALYEKLEIREYEEKKQALSVRWHVLMDANKQLFGDSASLYGLKEGDIVRKSEELEKQLLEMDNKLNHLIETYETILAQVKEVSEA